MLQNATIKTVCTHCGSIISADAPHVDLNLNVIAWRGNAVRLTPHQAVILATLAKSFGRFVAPGLMISDVYGACEPDNSSDSIAVTLDRARPALRRLNLRVEGRPGREGGRRLVEAA